MTVTGTRAPSKRRSLVVVWVVVVLALVDVVIGGGWDAEYHETVPFDGFFSPPHVFIYTVAAILMGFVAYLDLDPRRRADFGPGIRLPVVGLHLPAALVLLNGACGVLALAGPLDAAWHTAFGLDETRWSFPHAMIGASLALLAIGMLAVRVALEDAHPMWPPTRYFLGLVLVLSLGFFLGPIGQYPTVEVAAVEASRGALARDEDVQHVLRVVTAAELTHRNVAFPVLAAVWSGAVLGFLRGIDRRRRYWIPVAVLAGLALASGATDRAETVGLEADAASATGLPLLTAVLAYVLAWRLRPALRYAAAGAALAVHATAVWADSPFYLVGALVAPLGAVAGAGAGHWMSEVVRDPARTSPGPVALVLAVGLAIPAVTGVVDLTLRLSIP